MWKSNRILSFVHPTAIRPDIQEAFNKCRPDSDHSNESTGLSPSRLGLGGNSKSSDLFGYLFIHQNPGI